MKRNLLLLLLCSRLAVPLSAEEGAGERGAQFEQLAHQGLRDLFNLNYAGAQKNFNALESLFPDNPLGPYSQTTVMWWELTNEFDEKNPLLERRFLNKANRTIALCRKLLKKNGDPTGDVHLCLGGALGLKARWEAIQSRWIKAYFDGKDAYDAQREAIKINPQLYDAYLGVGIFHYYTATLPAVVKVLAKLVFGGNREQGISEIRLAMTKGRFSRTAAQLFLVGIYSGEKNYAEALALARDGRKEYPQSPFFHFLELLLLESDGQAEALRAGALDYLDRIKKGESCYFEKYTHRGLYALANSYLLEKRAQEALAIYDDILAKYRLEDRWISLTYLHRGEAHDLLGEREKALADYRAVLSRRNVWEIHDQARRLIEKPY